MITIYFGKSASGKDTFMKKCLATGKCKPIVSYTTRPMREGEKNGADYNFVTPEEFRKIEDQGKMLESRSYDTLVGGKHDTWHYGSPRINPDEDYVAVLDIDGIRQYINAYSKDKIKLIYVFVEDNIRESRAKARGSFDKTEWDRRMADDAIKFSDKALSSLVQEYGSDIAMIDNSGDKPLFSYIKKSGWKEKKEI